MAYLDGQNTAAMWPDYSTRSYVLCLICLRQQTGCHDVRVRIPRQQDVKNHIGLTSSSDNAFITRRAIAE